jgi:2-succinyl-5-enolpyruvyl-6-hydroxy-3-cyclohexene-1-carboxylate synthase
MTNVNYAYQIVSSLVRLGVSDFVVCAGARNSVLVEVLTRFDHISVYSFFEERSAAFFAMGVARRLHRPVAVVTTSGTAAIELGPAMAEAFHSGLPLIAITADRPRVLRGTGAPQAIDQSGLFSRFCSGDWDLDINSNLEKFEIQLRSWKQAAPVHINCCFDEPLVDASLDWIREKSKSEAAKSAAINFEIGTDASSFYPLDLHPKVQENLLHDINGDRGHNKLSANAPKSSPTVSLAVQNLIRFVERYPCSVVLVGGLSGGETEAAVEILRILRPRPVYIESQSQLSAVDLAAANINLISNDASLNWALKNQQLDGVVRLGSIPTARIWRDLDMSSCPAEVISISSLPFSGLSRGEFFQCDLTEFAGELKRNQAFVVPVQSTVHSPGQKNAMSVDPKFIPPSSEYKSQEKGDIFAIDAKLSSFKKNLFAEFPLSEPALVRKLSKLPGAGSFLYLGNSLPIREWDFACESPIEPSPSAASEGGSKLPGLKISANRGVNGIDGQLSTFYGEMRAGNAENWAVLGDLTTLYDMTGPWAIRQRQAQSGDQLQDQIQSVLVVINNGGGQIFSRVTANQIFQNAHDLGFEDWAKMWGLTYHSWTDVPSQQEWRDGDLEKAAETKHINSRHQIIELRPNPEQTKNFWSRWDAILEAL